MGGSHDWALLTGKGCRYTSKKAQLIQLVKHEPEFSSSIRNLESLSWAAWTYFTHAFSIGVARIDGGGKVRTHPPFYAENHNHAFSTTATSKPTITNCKQKHIVTEETSSAFVVSSKSPASNYSTTALPQQHRNGQPHIGIRNIPSQKRLPRLDDLCKWIGSNLLDHGINAIRIALGLHRRLFFLVMFCCGFYCTFCMALRWRLRNAHFPTLTNKLRPIKNDQPSPPVQP